MSETLATRKAIRNAIWDIVGVKLNIDEILVQQQNRTPEISELLFKNNVAMLGLVKQTDLNTVLESYIKLQNGEISQEDYKLVIDSYSKNKTIVLNNVTYTFDEKYGMEFTILIPYLYSITKLNERFESFVITDFEKGIDRIVVPEQSIYVNNTITSVYYQFTTASTTNDETVLQDVSITINYKIINVEQKQLQFINFTSNVDEIDNIYTIVVYINGEKWVVIH